MKSFALLALAGVLSLTVNEVATAADTYGGHGNLGHVNVGHGNVGHGNVGYGNVGYGNVGHVVAGHRNPYRVSHSGYGYQLGGGHRYFPQNGHGVYRGLQGHGVSAYGHSAYGNAVHGNSFGRTRGLRISAPHFGLRIGH